MQQTWLIFTGGRYLTNQRSVLSPFLSQLSEVKHITATVTYCLQSSGWVATTCILHVSVRKFGNCRSFSQTLLGLYPRACAEYRYSVGLTPIELNPVMSEGCRGCERPARFRKLQPDPGKIIIPQQAIELSPELVYSQNPSIESEIEHQKLLE